MLGNEKLPSLAQVAESMDARGSTFNTGRLRQGKDIRDNGHHSTEIAYDGFQSKSRASSNLPPGDSQLLMLRSRGSVSYFWKVVQVNPRRRTGNW
jgi:hypothetical protein